MGLCAWCASYMKCLILRVQEPQPQQGEESLSGIKKYGFVDILFESETYHSYETITNINYQNGVWVWRLQLSSTQALLNPSSLPLIQASPSTHFWPGNHSNLAFQYAGYQRTSIWGTQATFPSGTLYFSASFSVGHFPMNSSLGIKVSLGLGLSHYYCLLIKILFPCNQRDDFVQDSSFQSWVVIQFFCSSHGDNLCSISIS